MGAVGLRLAGFWAPVPALTCSYVSWPGLRLSSISACELFDGFGSGNQSRSSYMMALGGCSLRFSCKVPSSSLRWAEDKGKSCIQGPCWPIACSRVPGWRVPRAGCLCQLSSTWRSTNLATCVGQSTCCTCRRGEIKSLQISRRAKQHLLLLVQRSTAAVLYPSWVTIGELPRVLFKVGG